LASSAFQGSLFSTAFVEGGITELPDWSALSDADLLELRDDIAGIFARFPTSQTPNETQTEDDLIWRTLTHLGWAESLRQQNLTTRGRQDVPDGILFADIHAKERAIERPDEWRRYEIGSAIIESKRWNRPLDRRSDQRQEVTAPSTQMLRYLRRVDDLTNGALRWGILTNGGRWRLYYSGARSVAEEFFEVNLAAVLGVPGHNEGLFKLTPDQQRHWFKVFALVFRREAFIPGPDHRTFHKRALDEGKFYEERVAKDLSDLVFGFVFPDLARGIAAAAPAAPLNDVRDAALVLLYRLLFILYAEDRDLLPVHERRYDDYGLRERVRLDVGRRMDAGDTISTTAARYWSVLDDLCRAIDNGDADIGLPPYNGGLFNKDRTPLLTEIRLGDALVANVIDKMSFIKSEQGRRYINYRDLSVQQLGSIYERLLEHEIVREDGDVRIRPNIFARKASGSYYTPDDLVGLILDETLEPLVDRHLEAFTAKVDELDGQPPPGRRMGSLTRLDPAMRLLELKICDPAMGSGHFLVSVVDKITDHIIDAMAEAEVQVTWGDYISPVAERIEAIRNTIMGNAEARGWSVNEDQLDDRHIIRRMVLKRCVYGVDKNPMAVELAKVALWLHTFTVGAPLSFLDHHLRVGDSLFGSWVKAGIEKVTRYGSPLVLHGPIRSAIQSAAQMQLVEGLTDAEIAEAERSSHIFDQITDMTSPLLALLSFIHALDWLNLRDRQSVALIKHFFDGQFGDPVEIAMGRAEIRMGRDTPEFLTILNAVRELINEERFLHWQVTFPGVWTDWEAEELRGGFDAIVGNPPWDRMKLQQVEWFAARKREIAMAPRASDRKAMIEHLIEIDDPLAADFVKASRRAEIAAQLARDGGDYPLLSGGDINLYSLFVERAQTLIKPDGMVGLLTPIGIGTDMTNSKFFSMLAKAEKIKTFIAFENRRGWLFADVHHEDQPTVFVFGGQSGEYTKFQFAVRLTEMPHPDGSSTTMLSAGQCRKINPNTGTVPMFRSMRDTALISEIYERLPVLVDRSDGTEVKAWPVRYMTMFHMTNDSGLFRTSSELKEKEGAYPIGGQRLRNAAGDWVPLFEGKMVSMYNHRYAGVRTSSSGVSGQGVAIHSQEEQLADPGFLPTPRYWISENNLRLRLPFVVGFNDICNTNNKRSLIAAMVPRSGYGNKLPILVPELNADSTIVVPLLGNLCAIVCDYVARQKIQSRNLNLYILEQLPIVPPETYDQVHFGGKSAGEIVREAVLELTYTAHDMAPFARAMGYVKPDGAIRPPFIWDEDRRLHLRAKLDALYFHLYGVMNREDVSYIYSTFPIVEREETETWGRYRSRDLCLAYMNALAAGHPDAVIEG
jgi:hypothetical protein